MEPYEINKLIGERVDQLLLTLGVSRQEMADQLGIGTQMLGKKLRGKGGWSAPDIVLAAVLLRVEPSVLINGLWNTEQDADHRSALLNILLESLPDEERRHLRAVQKILLSMNLN